MVMSEKDEEMTVDQEQTGSEQEETNAAEAAAENQEQDANKEFGEAESQNPIARLEQELIQEKDKFTRLYAEFENFRRRTAKERIELIGTATGDLMKEILPVLDDFERAVASNESADDIQAVKDGFTLLQNKLSSLLGNKGLKALDSVGKDFDPDFHEAVAQIPAPSKKEKGKIIDVVERGYELNEKIIRHPKVVVGT